MDYVAVINEIQGEKLFEFEFTEGHVFRSYL